MRLVAQFAVVLAVCLSISLAAAQDKVVVVPLGGKKCTSPMENSFTNSIGMTFNLIPAGTFIMGSPDGSGDEPAEPGRISDETQHQVTLTKPFYMSVTEVTNKQWNRLIVATGLGVNPSTSHTGDNYPVESVNWYEAAAFANYLSVAAGLTGCYNGNYTCTGSKTLILPALRSLLIPTVPVIVCPRKPSGSMRPGPAPPPPMPMPTVLMPPTWKQE